MTVIDDALNPAADTKLCPKCGLERPLLAFSVYKRNRAGRQSYCRQCMTNYRQENSGRIAATRKRNSRGADRDRFLRKAYGIPLSRYEEMLADQGGRCAICRTDDPGHRRGEPLAFSVDHDHGCCPGKTSCGACVRGLLCSRCNFGLGQFGDSPAVLMAALTYLGVQA